MPSRSLLCLLPTFVFAILISQATAVMPDVSGFRVDNLVFSGRDTEPTVRTTTIFLNDDVYDFMEKPQEAIVLESELGRFTLLNMARRIRAELSVEQVTDLTQGLRERAVVHENPFLRFLADPEFDESFDLAASDLTLDSPWITYRVEVATPENPAIVERYRAFADLYCQVNTMLNPRQSPPFARMQLNAALAQRGVIPAAIHLTLRPKRSFPPTRITLKSTHELVRSVGQPDLDRVAQTREFMNIFKLVSFDEYSRQELR
jgi:hypothetical protein